MAASTLGLKAFVSLIIGFFECLTFGIVSIGWPNLVILYKELNMFPGVCQNVTGVNSTVTCPEVDRYYNISFTATEILKLVFFLFWGIIFDKYGILVTRIVSA